MYNLFLDDVRDPEDVTWVDYSDIDDWTVIRDYENFTSMITKFGLPKFIAFDHDLSSAHYHDANSGVKNIDYDSYEEKTGYHCAKWLCEYCRKHKLPIPEFKVHSLNPVGKENIKALLSSCSKVIFD